MKELINLNIYVLYSMKITITKQIYKKIKYVNKTYEMLQKNVRNKNISKKIKIKEHNNRQNFNICIRNLDTNKERQKANKHF